jgi:Ca2+-transporting ATPase
MVFRDYVGILYVGGVMGAAAVALYAMAPDDPESLHHARALAFSLLALSPLIHAFNCRSAIRSAFTVRPLISIPLIAAVCVSATIHLIAVLVPSLQPVFKTFPVSLTEWAWVLGLAVLVIPAVELVKMVNRKRLELIGMGPPASTALPSRRGR